MIICQRICFPNSAFKTQMYQHVSIEKTSPKAHPDNNLSLSVNSLSVGAKKGNEKDKMPTANIIKLPYLHCQADAFCTVVIGLLSENIGNFQLPVLFEIVPFELLSELLPELTVPPLAGSIGAKRSWS